MTRARPTRSPSCAREAEEETGLSDLAPWPDAEIKHVAIVNVPAGKGEPAHEHADVRFFMATQAPDAIRPESAHAPLRWLSLPGGARPDLRAQPQGNPGPAGAPARTVRSGSAEAR